MMDFFQRLIQSQDAGSTQTQTQKEAMVDLLLLGMYADHTLSLAEQDFVNNEGTQIEWESGISFSGYLERTIPKVRTAQADVTTRSKFIDGIRDRLGNLAACERAIAELKALMLVDGVAPIEQEFIDDISAQLTRSA